MEQQHTQTHVDSLIERAKELESRCWKSANTITSTPVSKWTLLIGVTSGCLALLPISIWFKPVVLMFGGAGMVLNRSQELQTRDALIKSAQEVRQLKHDMWNWQTFHSPGQTPREVRGKELGYMYDLQEMDKIVTESF
jgi:hypothetical protein